MPDMLRLIGVRRDGGVHTEDDLRSLAQAAADGTVPDYQLTAWLMAAVLNPLSEQETAWLTLGMAESGERLDLAGLPKPWIDKHSTGGVGDKTTIVLLPLLAACGLTVVKMSGRGLGTTGGTIDKLGSVPGFRLDLSPEEMKAQASEIGLALTGQTPRLAPADKALYALRDASGTVESIPLIVSSILSKKIAGGAETVVLDVKCGSGAFMQNLADAKNLAESLTKTGHLAGLTVRARITDMDQPLGRAVGNAIEVKEALATLRGDGPPLLDELCRGLAEEVLVAVGVASDEAHQKVDQAFASGAVFDKASLWFDRQGADPAVFQSDDWSLAPVRQEVIHHDDEGWIERCDARTIGEAVVKLGGGRQSKTDEIDPRVGIEVLVHVGDTVAKGQPIAIVHAADDASAAQAAASVKAAIRVSSEPVKPRPVFLD